MFTRVVVICTIIVLAKAQGMYQNKTLIIDPWTRLEQLARIFLKSCSIILTEGNYASSTQLLKKCVTEKIIGVLDKILNDSVTNVIEGIKIVKNKQSFNFNRKSENYHLSKSKLENLLFNKIAEILDTRALSINLRSLADESANLVLARRRDRHNMAGTVMMFGMVAMGMILIPMGFKFLTILGAKALLLAKMALILTSIQGLKKVATSGIDYGLYQSQAHWHRDRLGSADLPDEQLNILHNYNNNLLRPL